MRCSVLFASAAATGIFAASLQAQTPAPAAPPDLTSYIRTPAAPHTPRINGPSVYGERPSRPFLYHLPVSGDRPMKIAARNLPAGVSLDPATGDITGRVTSPGRHAVVFTATNAAGKATRTVTFVIGSQICLTPPMGWNSWNYFAGSIDEGKIRGAAEAMVKTRLIDHGWAYINMDDRWEGERDAHGNMTSSAGFPHMKEMVDAIHHMGLKVGLYSSPGPFTCAGAPGSYQHENQDAQTYGEWGMDYLKYDWCSYDWLKTMARAKLFAQALPADANQIMSLAKEDSDAQETLRNSPGDDQAAVAKRDALSKKDHDLNDQLEKLYAHCLDSKRGEIESEFYKAPYRTMRNALNKVNRDIVFSFCQYGMGNVETWGAEIGGNTWRVTGDINASWPSVQEHGFELKSGLANWANPGHWNDPDMLEVGNGTLTPDENYTHMTQWCMLAAPLLIGTDMPKMSPFIVSLFSNDEVLAVNQDVLGKQGTLLRRDAAAKTEVWTKPLEGGSIAVAFYNRGETPADVSATWAELALSGSRNVRDLWRQVDRGAQSDKFTVTVAPHGAELFKIAAAK